MDKQNRPSFTDQILAGYRQAKRNRDPLAMAYYSGISSNASSCASWKQFKGSWAYTQWLQKSQTQNRISAAITILAFT